MSITEPTSAEEITLWQRVSLTVRDLDGRSVVDPVMVADASIKKLSPDLIRFAAHLMLRQIARQILRRFHADTTVKKPSGRKRAEDAEPTFAGDDFSLLQTRYPQVHSKPDDERGYVLRDNMTEEDWEWNLLQIGNEAAAKSAHREQLERWGIKIRGFRRRSKDEERA